MGGGKDRAARGISALWFIAMLAVAAVIGAKLWSDGKKRDREVVAAAAQKRQTNDAIEAERKQFEAKVAAERAKSDYAKSADALNTMRARWADARRIASATSRMSLAVPVASLQAIRRDVQAMMLPDCLSAARNRMVEAMQLQIDGFLHFMANTDAVSNLVSGAKLDDGDKLLRDAEAELQRCAAVT